MKLKLFTSDATKSSEKEFNLPTFEGSRGLQAVKEVVVAHRANARQGTRSTKTRAGTIKGKCAYMSPEQARGKLVSAQFDPVAEHMSTLLRHFERRRYAEIMHYEEPAVAPKP